VIVIALPIVIFITLQTLLFVVWGVNRRTLVQGFLLLGVLALTSAAVAAWIVSGYSAALAADPKASQQVSEYARWTDLNTRVQVLGWPLLALAAFASRKALAPKG